jgi:hypothetical protein
MNYYLFFFLYTYYHFIFSQRKNEESYTLYKKSIVLFFLKILTLYLN